MRIRKFVVGYMGTNCYFLEGNDKSKVVVVDPGAQCDLILEKLKESNQSVQYILLTHGHFDHLLALEELRTKTNAHVYIHEKDNEMLLDAKKSLTTYVNIETPQRPADFFIEDGQELDVGGEKMKVMHTPGHTPGSCCFICKGDLISGDTLFREGTGRYDLWGGNYYDLRSSLQKLAMLEGDYKIYPGHGNSTTLEYEKQNNIALM